MSQNSIMKRLRLNLNLTSVIITLAAGVLLPVVLSTAVGIVSLVFADDAGSIVMGVLLISFTVTAAGSGLVAVVLAGRKARMARLQADFVANVSHEFRTPLSAIRLYAQTLQSGRLGDDPKQTDECLATILRETEWLDAMLDRALTWRASSRNLLKLNMEMIPVAGAVSDAVSRFRSMVAPSELTLSLHINGELPVCHDPKALHAVVLNLLTNAYKYTGDEKRITVTVRDGNREAIIDVSDNGIGITPKEAKRVFQPFYRVLQHGRSRAGGAGLGLAITRYLVRRHGGTITVESEPAHGSTFRITLPATEST
jgi:two-component system phosphate regulon sensor histidine kinase PhoR